jgi:hypothetical protein
MGSRKRERAAWATGLSLILHVLMLTGMVVGLKIEKPPPEGQTMEVRLVLPPRKPPPPVPSASSPQKSPAGPPLRPHLAPPAPATVQGLPLPEAAPPGPAPAPSPSAGPQGLMPSLSGRLGCDDPLTFHLTPAQRQTCANNMAERARAAPQLALNIPGRKQEDYDRNVRCHAAYGKAAMPPSTTRTDIGVGGNALPPDVPGGLGFVPGPKDCGFGER